MNLMDWSWWIKTVKGWLWCAFDSKETIDGFRISQMHLIWEIVEENLNLQSYFEDRNLIFNMLNLGKCLTPIKCHTE